MTKWAKRFETTVRIYSESICQEKKSMASQLNYVNSVNCRGEHPYHMYFTNWSAEGTSTHLKKYTGHDRWKVYFKTLENGLTEMFRSLTNQKVT